MADEEKGREAMLSALVKGFNETSQSPNLPEGYLEKGTSGKALSDDQKKAIAEVNKFRKGLALAGFDKDGDGKLSPDELKLDGNNDGKISTDELATHFETDEAKDAAKRAFLRSNNDVSVSSFNSLLDSESFKLIEKKAKSGESLKFDVPDKWAAGMVFDETGRGKLVGGRPLKKDEQGKDVSGKVQTSLRNAKNIPRWGEENAETLVNPKIKEVKDGFQITDGSGKVFKAEKGELTFMTIYKEGDNIIFDPTAERNKLDKSETIEDAINGVGGKPGLKQHLGTAANPWKELPMEANNVAPDEKVNPGNNKTNPQQNKKKER